MERGEVRCALPTRQGKVEIVDVEMNDIEAGGFFANQFQHQDMVRQSVQAMLI
jgi:hypothetical protein